MKKILFYASLCLIISASLTFASPAMAQQCAIEPMDGRIIIDLGSPDLCSPIEVGSCFGQSGEISLVSPVPSGTYDVTLQSYDDHSDKPDQVQLTERYFLKLLDTSGDMIVETNAIDDLPDGFGNDNLIQLVNTSLFVNDDIGSLAPIHFCDDSTGNTCDFTVNSIVPVCVAFDLIQDSGTGRFTGGGRQIRVDGVRVTRGLTIHCDRLLSNNLEVNWQGNSFHMTEHLVTVDCSDSPDITQFPPAAPLDTLIGVGTGRYNGQDGFTIEFTLIDAGEPGTEDEAALLIYETANPSNVVLNVPLQLLEGGNLQAHYDQPHR